MFGGLLLFSTNTYAVVSTDNEAPVTTRVKTTNSENTPIREAVETRLSEAKLKICKRHEASINNVISRVSDRDQKRQNLFNATVEKIQAFYTNKNLSIANYDVLLSDLESKKLQSRLTIDAMNNTKVTFECNNNDPKGIVSSFKNNHSATAVELNNYKESVKAFLKVVKTAAAVTTGDNQ